MTEPAENAPKPRKPASTEERDASRDMFADADHMSPPLVFDDDGNVVSGADPTRAG